MTDVIRIEKDIPLAHRVTTSKYPFPQMQVGDSFYTDLKATSLRSLATHYAKRENGTVKFAVRIEGDGSRVWRVA